MTIAGQRTITLVIAQFEDIVFRGLEALIAGDPTLAPVATGVFPARLAEALLEHQPDVAIVNFGSLPTPAALRELHAANPTVRLIVLANNPSSAESRQLVGFGATACLAKHTEGRDLLSAIHLAARGMHVLPPGDERAAPAAAPTPLTPREADVLELLQAGSSNAEIAVTLHIGVETVRTHARSIYRKLGVATRRELRLSP